MRIERPILFSAPMVRAILEGRKTQTRRVVKPQPGVGANFIDFIKRPIRSMQQPPVLRAWFSRANDEQSSREITCPYGMRGNRLWVRETYRRWVPNDQSVWRVKYRADDSIVDTNCEWGGDSWSDRHSPADAGCDIEPARWTPTIHMPRWASRITLEVTGVRVERLQEIREADARAEGVERVIVGEGWRRYNADPRDDAVGDWPCDTARESYETLWESINGDGSWASNPWVWVVEFKRMTP